MAKAVYPGTFDPFSNGHLDIVKRASQIFDEVHILVSCNIKKHPTFTAEERVNLIKMVVKDMSNVKVISSNALVVQYAKENEIKVIIRGLRNYQDYAIAHNNSFDYDVDNYILYSELNQQLQKELDKLPKEMREVFEMHRFKNKKYHEIANELNVSVRTIENRISKVLEVLRKKMEGFYDFILCFFI